MGRRHCPLGGHSTPNDSNVKWASAPGAYVHGDLPRLSHRRLCEVAFWHEGEAEGGQSQFGFAPVVQTSTCSAMARASSTSMPRYLTVLSILVCPSSSCTARKLPVRR